MSRSRLVIGAILTLAFTSTGSAVGANPHANSHENANQKQAKPEATEALYPLPTRNLSELFRQIFKETSGTFYDDRSIGGQFNALFGTSKQGYVEHQVANYGKEAHRLYEQYRHQQMATPPMRGRDLENPFDTSLGSPDFPDNQ